MSKWLSLLLIFTIACSTGQGTHQRGPAQEFKTSLADENLKKWDSVREGFWDRFYEDPMLGLFVNSKRPIAFDLIKGARRTIDIEIYEMKDPTFRRLLLEALDRGVQVRIVKDSNTVGDTCNELEAPEDEDEPDCAGEKKFVSELLAKGAKYVWFNKKELCGIPGRSCFQHGKMLITDNKYLLMSTGNFNSSSFCNPEVKLQKCNRDYSYVTKNREVIAGLRDVWEFDNQGEKWEMKQVISELHPGLTVSPHSVPRLVSLIESAQESIWIQNQYLEEPAINEALVKKAREGVKVHVQVAAFCNFGDMSENKRNKTYKIFSDFEDAGIISKVFVSRMQINGKPGYLHSKAILIDETVGWIGSINGSQTSTLQNREFGIIFKSRKSLVRLQEQVVEDFEHPLAQDWKEAIKCGKASQARESLKNPMLQ